jgi:hypothetical protein
MEHFQFGGVRSNPILDATIRGLIAGSGIPVVTLQLCQIAFKGLKTRTMNFWNVGHSNAGMDVRFGTCTRVYGASDV